MRTGWFFLLLWLALVAAAPFQGEAPPPPPGWLDALAACLNGEWGNCLTLAIQSGAAYWVIPSVIVTGAAIYILYRYLKGAGKQIEKLGEEDVRRFLDSEISAQERAYLVHARASYRYFKFTGLKRSRAEGLETPQLNKAYVSLRMLPLRAVEKVPGDLQSGKKESAVEAIADAHQQPGPINLTAAIRECPRLAITGAAGSGKSTLLQWAGLACACARLNLTEELSPEMREFLDALGEKKAPLPFLIPLRPYNRYCKDKGKSRTARSLLEFMVDYFSGKLSHVNLEATFFQEQLKKGCLIMFDGMDEVPTEDRPDVRTAVLDFLHEYNSPGLRCLITSRFSAAYITDAMPDFRRCDVQPLTPEQRDELIHLWYRAALPDDQQLAWHKANSLCKRIENSDPRVQRLATTPLMTTIFALVGYTKDLPQQRARVYEDAIEILLSEKPYKDEYASELAMGWETRRDRLMRIAFELQEKKMDSLQAGDLIDLIWQRFEADEEKGRALARDFLEDVAGRGGLLEEEDERYGFFRHATFREYLAGRYLAEALTPQQQCQVLERYLEDDQWEETILLAAGYKDIQGEIGANNFIKFLASLGKTESQRARALTLAGLALADLEPGRRFPETVKELTEAMLPFFPPGPTTEKPKVKTSLRRGLGLALGAIGDPRLNPLDPPMLPIPAGEFRMGTSQEDEEQLKAQGARVWDDEKPDHIVYLSAYAIGKYPVTNLEFSLFVDKHHGYEEKSFWSEDGWRWRKGEWESNLLLYSEDIREDIRKWLASRHPEKRNQPFWWDDPQWRAPNLPVVGVCWFEAEAYCNWLKAITGRDYRLPTEAEWEKAARGTQGFLWPWGNEWDADRCNNEEADESPRKTTPVGLYPHGASPYGAADMAGNVWEWCQDWYDPELYARRAGAPVIDPRGPEVGERRVVRGGSWYGNRNRARCAVRNWLGPDLFSNVLGFRLALSYSFPPGR